jgi:hypothetical protein
MKKRPLSITIIGWIALAIGSIALAVDLLQLFRAFAGQVSEAQPLRFSEESMILMTHALAVLAGVFLLRGCNWARWLLIAWMAFHVALSLFHRPFELIVHALMLAALVYFLFRPAASRYFRLLQPAERPDVSISIPPS